jgi:hypothetical protein
MHTKVIETCSVDVDKRNQLLIIYSVIIKYVRKNEEYNGAVYQPFTDFKKAHDSVGRGFI